MANAFPLCSLHTSQTLSVYSANPSRFPIVLTVKYMTTLYILRPSLTSTAALLLSVH